MAKQRAIRLYLDETFDEKNYKRDVNTVKVGNDDEVNFTAKKVFVEVNIPRWQFWRKARRIILFVDGSVDALGFSKVTKSMQQLWTKKEATNHVKKEIAKARLKFKPLTWGQILFIGGLLVIVILLQIYQISKTPF